VEITFFGRTAEIANQYLKRGSKVLVDGRLKFDMWTDQNGGKRSKHSVTVSEMKMLSTKNENRPAPEIVIKKEPLPQQPDIDINEDEIPF
jgi:single-strand DNA-binding protein